MSRKEIEVLEDVYKYLEEKAEKRNMTLEAFVDHLLVRGLDFIEALAGDLVIEEDTADWIASWYKKLKKPYWFSSIDEFVREAVRFYLFEKKLL